MKLVNIPDAHHVVRHCKRRLIIRENGVPVGVHPEFFYLRAAVGPDNKPETYLSAFYYEFYAGDDAAKMGHCLSAVPFVPRKGEAMVRMNASTLRAEGKASKVSIRVVHETTHKAIPSKARIEGMPKTPNEKLAAELCAKAVLEITPVPG